MYNGSWIVGEERGLTHKKVFLPHYKLSVESSIASPLVGYARIANKQSIISTTMHPTF
jgi:hypothetical protein